jgi:hypothetical protein
MMDMVRRVSSARQGRLHSGKRSLGKHPVVGRWRIVDADLWDRDYLDLSGPAEITFGSKGDGEFSFGALQGNMDLKYSPTTISFTWAGFDEGDEVSGAGSASLDDNGDLRIELSFHLGDDAILTARRE